MTCSRIKSILVGDNTIKAEGLADFFKNLGKKGLNVSNNMAKNVSSNPGRALDLTAKLARAAVSKKSKSKQALSTLPELITFYNTREGLYVGKFVSIFFDLLIKEYEQKLQLHIKEHHCSIGL